MISDVRGCEHERNASLNARASAMTECRLQLPVTYEDETQRCALVVVVCMNKLMRIVGKVCYG